jgi:hypothetical protein
MWRRPGRCKRDALGRTGSRPRNPRAKLYRPWNQQESLPVWRLYVGLAHGIPVRPARRMMAAATGYGYGNRISVLGLKPEA